MPSPSLPNVQQSPWLNNVAIGYKNPGYQLQERVCRTIPVTKTKGTYVIWTKGEVFADEAEVVGVGGDAPRGTRSFSTDTYEVQSYEFETEVYDDIVDESAGSVVQAQVAGTEYAIDKVLLGWERAIATLLTTTGNWTTTKAISSGSEWDTAGGGDPIGEIRLAIETIEGLIGITDLTMACGWRTAYALRFHPAIRDYIKWTGAAPSVAPLSAVAEMFGLREIVVSTAKYNSAKKNLTATLASIMSDTVWIGYVPQTPSTLVPSACYGFGVAAPPITNYREEKNKRDVIRARKRAVAEKTCADAGYTITNALSAI